jgi:hypothetical protein
VDGNLGQPAIDSLAVIRSELTNLNAPPEVVQAWFDVLESPDEACDDPPTLVRKLIEAFSSQT